MTVICIYAKPPLPGATKSRLAESIGTETAAFLARAMLIDIIDCVAQTPNVKRQLWHPPNANAADFADLLPSDFACQCQQGEDLGQRMSHTFAQLLEQTTIDRVIIIGSDCITHSASTLQTAIDALADAEIVLQPALDGGYVLVGQRRWHPEMFSDIPWGTEQVMSRTRRRLNNTGSRFCLLEKTFDVDRVADLDRLRIFLAKNERPATVRFLAKFGF